ncbi:hypothetical protein PUN28_020837 [Cardiocondyla obscurior]|uniref:Uncharacterized protein n=1 Tax=Cardiocondyla obscurior TaxID=286306 RepID=A0AAW2E976_9HYME
MEPEKAKKIIATTWFGIQSWALKNKNLNEERTLPAEQSLLVEDADDYKTGANIFSLGVCTADLISEPCVREKVCHLCLHCELSGFHLIEFDQQSLQSSPPTIISPLAFKANAD